MKKDDMEPDESLELIRRMIAEGRKAVADNGKHYILWGCVVVGATALNVLTASLWKGWLPSLLVWILAYGGGFVASFAMARSDRVKAGASSFSGRVSTALWAGFLIASLVALGLCVLGRLPLGTFMATLTLMAGLVYWALAAVMGLASMRWLAGLWWAGAIACAFLPGLWPVLAADALIVACEILPGVLLYRRSRKAGSHA